MKLTTEDFDSICKRVVPKLCEQLFYKRKELYNQKQLYHYTNLNAFIGGIVCDGREINKEICLYATHWNYLNDPKEIILGHERFVKIIKKENEQGLLEEYLKENKQISLSRQKDFLPMWGLYGSNGSGIMLSFNTEKLLKKYGYLIMPCIYQDSEYDKNAFKKLMNLDFKGIIDELNNEELFYPIVLVSLLFISILKDNSYEYEDEVRIVGLGNKYFDMYSKEEFRVANGNKIIPYTKVYFPKDFLEEVIVGPNQDAEKNCETIKKYLASIGLEHVNVIISTVPYKG